MVVDAFVLPIPGRSLGVVFWDRPRSAPRRAGGGGSEQAALAVYSPGVLSPGELVELRGALTDSLGTALGGNGVHVPRFQLWTWWAVGVFATVMLALRATEFGPAFSWLALIAVGTTLPFGLQGGTGGAASAAARLTRRLSELEPAPGDDPRQRERLAALWQSARKLHGSDLEQLSALESACREQSWPAAARIYADLANAISEPVRPQGWRSAWARLTGRGRTETSSRSVRPYGTVSMRAWP
jgi:hypothetical protein